MTDEEEENMSVDSLQTDSVQGTVPRDRYRSSQLEFLDVSKFNILATVILPAFNEVIALPKVLDEIFLVVDNRYEVIVVDDGSTDETATVAASYPCHLIRHESNCGKGSAVQTGLRYAHGQYIVIMDADATYPASAIPKIVKALESNDMVRCIRQRDINMPKVNQVGNHLFDWLLTRIVGLEGGDHLSGLYGLQRRILEQMKIESDGFDLETEISFKANTRGMKIATFPITYQPRLGEKKLHPFRDGTYILNRILLLILVYNPTMVFVVPGLLIMALAIIGAVVLSETPVITPYFGLDIHSFILAALGVLGGFQLVVFGIAASLYAVEVGYKPRRWLSVLSSAPVRLGASAIGLILAFFEFFHIASMVVGWLYQGAGAFTNTREVVSAATIMVGSMQLLSAALFISIFAGRIDRKQRKNVVSNENLRRQA
jgi:glycosyltransferase involved in cell wall biosynthesis